MDEDQWQLLEDLKESMEQLTVNVQMIAEIMLFDLKKKYGDYVAEKIYKRL